jgi:membrane-bound lytic murein transglycosylase D
MPQKIVPFFLLLVLPLGRVLAQTAATPYRVPRSVEFAGVTVKFDDGARQLVQTDVNALMSNRRVLDSRLERVVQYFPLVEGILAEEEVPTDFKYLVVQESGLVPDAVSTSNAVGFWQFKKETAGDFGLRVDDQVDERKNIHASTRAAAQYLKRNNQALNNWVSTLYSYYLGLGGIKQLVPEDWMGASQITVNNQTDRYILRCLAHKIVFEQEIETYKPGPVGFYEYRYANGKTFAQIAAELGVDEAELRRHNRWVGGSTVPMDKEYVMLVPTTSQEQLASVRAKAVPGPGSTRTEVAKATQTDLGFPVLKRLTPANVKGKNTPIFYEINGKPGILAQVGDSPEKLADRADVSLRRFLRFNDLRDNDRIVPGEVYYLKKKARKAVVPYHTTQPDQTLWQVSQQYGLRMKFLLKYNRLETVQRLQPGRILWLQKKRPLDQPVEVIKLPDTQPPLPVQPGPAPRPTRLPDDSPTGTPPPQARPAMQASAKPSVPVSAADREVDVVIPSGGSSSKTSATPRGSRVVLVPENGPVSATSGNPVVERKPALKSTQTPPKKGVDVDAEYKLDATPRTASTPSAPAPRATDRSRAAEKTAMHTVEQGETFFSIARKYGLSVAELRELNGLSENPAVRIGDELVILTKPGTGSGASAVAPSATPKSAANPKADAWTEHTVQQGETFFSLTRKYNVTPQDLRDWNGFADYPTLKIGQVIKVKK